MGTEISIKVKKDGHVFTLGFDRVKDLEGFEQEQCRCSHCGLQTKGIVGYILHTAEYCLAQVDPTTELYKTMREREAIAIASPDCKHMDFESRVNVHRIQDGPDEPVKGFYADVTVKCSECEIPFHFIGLRYGCTPDAPRTDPHAIEARMPIAPGPNLCQLTGKLFSR